MINILVVSFCNIYPISTGASFSQIGAIRLLSNYVNVSLLLPEHNVLKKSEFTELKDFLPNVKLYQAFDFLPEKSNEKDVIALVKGGIKRTLRSIVFFAKNYLLKFKKEDIGIKNLLSEEKQYEKAYSSWNPFYIHNSNYVEKILEIVSRDCINIVQLEYTDNLNLAAVIPADVKIVFVEHECLFYRLMSHADARKVYTSTAKYIQEFYKMVEASLLKRADGIITFNEVEALQLKTILEPGSKTQVLVSPFPMLKREFRQIEDETNFKLDKLIFVGAEAHFPNKDAAEWFIDEVSEAVLNEFGLQLHVVGKWKSTTIKNYKNHPSKVKFLGFVDDVYEVSRNSICIAPVRIGGGLKTKILLAMAQGLPVVCTKFAAEGINANHLESILIADDKDSYLWSINYLVSNLHRARNICINAQDIIRQQYSEEVVCSKRYSFYKQLLKDTSGVFN